MFRFYNLFLFFFVIAQAGPGTLPLKAQKKYIFTQPKMGSPFRIIIYGRDSAAIAQVADNAFKQVDTLNLLFSDYINNSELSRLSAGSGTGQYVPVSAPMLDILRRSLQASRLSGGSFDITVGPVVKRWRKARKDQVFPDRAAIKAALRSTGYRYIHLDTARSAVWLEKKGMQLDLGGIGKGYAAQAALDYIRKAGYPAAMTDAGGDMALGDAPGGDKGWLIAINMPEQRDALLPKMLQLHNCAVATSGDVYQYLTYKGKRYSHIIDPRTGMGVTFQRNVTVIAPEGATADWLAKAGSILPLRKAFRLVNRIPGAEMLVTELRKGKLFQKSSAGFYKN
ncbi:FAD:protein FMN transferase [Compostibacter hankyongensis]|uniref:FAD:protein FMN transferase n=1 Tax=Compostibacter hankyongensis TaxID=1007089 RepID=A0ABP8FNN0_9BACT